MLITAHNVPFRIIDFIMKDENFIKDQKWLEHLFIIETNCIGKQVLYTAYAHKKGSLYHFATTISYYDENRGT